MTAPAELVIEVTADDIRLGERSDACRCPIARAAARLLKGSIDEEPAVVGPLVLLAVLPGDVATTEYELPEEAAQFVEDFDDWLTVAPFTFTARLKGDPS